jgi:hypothetical protein
MGNRFGEAPGEPDGIKLSRFQQHGDAPFGKPFNYTDAADLTSPPWYRRLFGRRRKPVGWAVAGAAREPEADIVTSTSSPRISPVEAGAIVKVFDQTVIIGATEYEQENP